MRSASLPCYMQRILCATVVMEQLKIDIETSEINNNLSSQFTVVCGAKSKVTEFNLNYVLGVRYTFVAILSSSQKTKSD